MRSPQESSSLPQDNILVLCQARKLKPSVDIPEFRKQRAESWVAKVVRICKSGQQKEGSCARLILEVHMGFPKSLCPKAILYSWKTKKIQGLRYINIAAFMELTAEQRWGDSRVLREEQQGILTLKSFQNEEIS